MSLRDCIKSAVDQKEITLEEGQALEKRYDALVKRLFSKGAAKAQLIAELEAEAIERKRRALLTEQARQTVEPEILNHRDKDGRQNPAEAFVLLHEHFGQAKFEDLENKRLAILGQAHAKMEGLLHDLRKGAVTGDLRRRRAAVAARMDNVVSELFGQGSGDDAAKALAAAWTDVAEDLRQRFNAAGGAIRKLERWGLPQYHNPEALLTAGREGWISRIAPLLDLDKMSHPITGAKMTADELRDSLRAIWDRITTDGWIDREPTGAAVGKGAMFKQHADHRFLHFKDAKAWLTYARDFGEGDPFAAMMAHVGSMARDIAAMERLGPNPEAMRNYLKQLVQKQAAMVRPVARTLEEQTLTLRELSAKLTKPVAQYETLVQRHGEILAELHAIRSKYKPEWGGKASKRDKGKMQRLNEELARVQDGLAPWTSGKRAIVETDQAVAKQIDTLLDDMKTAVPWPDDARPTVTAQTAIFKADEMWAAQRGGLNTPVNSKMANTLDAARAVVTSAVLGSAALSAVTDVAFGKAARGFAGLPKSTMSVLSGVVSQFSPANRREAVRAGLILDSAVHAMHRQARYAGSLSSKTWTGFLADRVIGLQGLSAWTQAGKHAFGMALQAELADRVGLPLAQVPDVLRNTLERHGITAAEWDQIRASALYEPEPGATFLRPAEIAKAHGSKLAEKYLAMILRETRYAVPEPTVRSSVFLKGGARPGTLVGELARGFAQFKSFGVAVVMLHGGRTAQTVAGSGRAAGAKYAGALLISSAIFGALAIQLKEVVNGRDPRDMTKPEFWGAASLQGGGWGIWGDFLFADVNRFGGGLSDTVAGPLVGFANDARKLTIGNIIELAQGNDTKAGKEAVAFGSRYMPGSSLWYTRAAWERIVVDQLHELADPHARQAFRAKIANRKREYGNGFWWAPGENRPSRGPRLENAVGR
ncbi:MAG: hypothetical protein ACRCS9_08740 [Hyphomicrobium sp.]